MPPKQRPGRSGVLIAVELPPALLASIEALASQRGHTRVAEIRQALERHVAHPPEPEPFPTEVKPAPEKPKRPPGRPRKHPPPTNGETAKRPRGRPRKMSRGKAASK